MSLADFKVVSFESRRPELVENLIRQYGGQCFNAPSVRERPIERDEECLRFVEDVIRGDYEAVVFTTGVRKARSAGPPVPRLDIAARRF